MLSVNNFRVLEIIESRCQMMSKCISVSLSLTALEVKYFVPETLRIRFLASQPELLSQNTCWLHRRARADHVTARVNPERRIEKANLFKCFLPCVPLETDPLSLCWVPGEACLGVERTVNPHHLSTASSHKECISRTKSLEYFLLPGTCTCKKCTKYQGILVILVGAFFLPKETSYGEIWCMSHWEGFWIPHISYSKNFTKSIICCLNYLSQATLSQNRK